MSRHTRCTVARAPGWWAAAHGTRACVFGRTCCTSADHSCGAGAAAAAAAAATAAPTPATPGPLSHARSRHTAACVDVSMHCAVTHARACMNACMRARPSGVRACVHACIAYCGEFTCKHMRVEDGACERRAVHAGRVCATMCVRCPPPLSFNLCTPDVLLHGVQPSRHSPQLRTGAGSTPVPVELQPPRSPPAPALLLPLGLGDFELRGLTAFAGEASIYAFAALPEKRLTRPSTRESALLSSKGTGAGNVGC